MMKYKLGDYVRVRKDLEVDKMYGNSWFVQLMEKHCGKIYEVVKAFEDGKYYLKGASPYFFSNEMLEPVEDLEPTYTRLEMVQKLIENPERKAKMIVDSNGFDIDISIVESKTNNIVEANKYATLSWVEGMNPLTIPIHDKSRWKIIELPKKLKQMSFGEAYWWYGNTEDVYGRDLKSVLTGEDFSRSYCKISKEELMGLWTVKGVYDESEGE